MLHLEIQKESSRAASDTRALTYREIELTLSDDHGEDFVQSWRKLGKIDRRLYGIKLRGERREGQGKRKQSEGGTSVKDSEGREGVVIGYAIDKNTCSGLFDVRSEDGTTAAYGLHDVLDLAANCDD